MSESLREMTGKKESLEDNLDTLNEQLAQMRAKEQLILSQVAESKEEVNIAIQYIFIPGYHNAIYLFIEISNYRIFQLAYLRYFWFWIFL